MMFLETIAWLKGMYFDETRNIYGLGILAIYKMRKFQGTCSLLKIKIKLL